MTISLDSPTHPVRRLIVGVDTHKHIHVAVAIDSQGARIEDRSFAADSHGYRQLADWAKSLGRVDSFGIEGTNSYGAGLTSVLRRAGFTVIEVNRGDRRTRRANGKSDPLDAEVAARSVLSGQARAVAKCNHGHAEMLRQIKVARDTAVKARTSAIITLKQIVVNAPAELRELLQPLADKALIERCARFRRRSSVDSTFESAKHTLRALARRWLSLAEEVAAHDRLLDQLTTAAAPTLRDGFGIGPDTAATMLAVFGDNPERIRSEAAFAKLCGACPIPASSGMSTGRHRLNQGGHQHANAALYRTVIVRMRFHQPTIDYMQRRTAQGRPKREIIRCLKRFLAREIYQRVMTDHRSHSDAESQS